MAYKKAGVPVFLYAFFYVRRRNAETQNIMNHRGTEGSEVFTESISLASAAEAPAEAKGPRPETYCHLW